MPKQIKLTQGQFAVVDSKNYKWLLQWKWCARWNKSNQSFYAVRMSEKKNGKQYTIYMAREILGLEHGNRRQADHRNHNTLDNRESNLRAVTHQQNNFNRKNPKGYCWRKDCKKYMVYIKVNGKQTTLGYFSTSEEAHNVYLKAKKKYHRI